MDFRLLRPDMETVAKTDIKSIDIDCEDRLHLSMVAATALMLIFTLTPWFGIIDDGHSITRLGIGLWEGFLAALAALIALFGATYRHYALSFCASAIGLLLAIISLLSIHSLEIQGELISADLMKRLIRFGGDVHTTHIGAWLYLLAAIGSMATSFMKIMDITIDDIKSGEWLKKI